MALDAYSVISRTEMRLTCFHWSAGLAPSMLITKHTNTHTHTVLPSSREKISLRLPLDDHLASTVLSRRYLEQALHL